MYLTKIENINNIAYKYLNMKLLLAININIYFTRSLTHSLYSLHYALSIDNNNESASNRYDCME